MGNEKCNRQEMEKSSVFWMLGSYDFFDLNLHN